MSLDDFLSRVRNYEAVYQTITDAEDTTADEEEVRRRLDGDHRLSSGRSPLAKARAEGGSKGDSKGGESVKLPSGRSSGRSSDSERRAPDVLRYIQIIDAGRKLVACRADGIVINKVRRTVPSRS